MTTESATKIIAYTYDTGENPVQLTEQEKQWLKISDSEIERMAQGKAQGKKAPAPIQIQRHCVAMYEQARGWNWGAVQEHILCCYALLAAAPPEIDNHGLAFHRGAHPIQQALCLSPAPQR